MSVQASVLGVGKGFQNLKMQSLALEGALTQAAGGFAAVRQAALAGAKPKTSGSSGPKGFDKALAAIQGIKDTSGALRDLGLEEVEVTVGKIASTLATVRDLGLEQVGQTFRGVVGSLGAIKDLGLESTEQSARGIAGSLGAIKDLGLEQTSQTLTEVKGALSAVRDLGLETTGQSLREVQGSLGAIKDLGLESARQGLTGLRDSLGAFRDLGLETVQQGLDGVRGSVGALRDLGVETVAQSFGGLRDGLGALRELGLEQVQGSLSGLEGSLSSLRDLGLETVQASLTGLGGSLGALRDLGLEAVQSSLSGIGETLSRVRESGADGARESLDGVREVLVSLGDAGAASARQSLGDLSTALNGLAQAEGGDVIRALEGVRASVSGLRDGGGLASVSDSLAMLGSSLERLGQGGAEIAAGHLGELGASLLELGRGGLSELDGRITAFAGSIAELGSSGFAEVRTQVQELGGTLVGLGREGLDDVRQRLEGFGGSISQLAQTGFADVRQKIVDFGASMRSLGQEGLGDARQQIAEFGAAVSTLGQEGFDDLRQKITGFGSSVVTLGQEGFADARQKVVSFGESMRSLRDVGLDDLRQKVGDFGSSMRFLGEAGFEDLRLSLGGFGSAMGTLREIGLDDIRQKLSDFGGSMSTLREIGLDDLGQKLGNFGSSMQALGSAGLEGVSQTLSGFTANLRTLATTGFDDLKQKFASFKDGVKEGVGQLGKSLDETKDALEKIQKLDLKELSTSFQGFGAQLATFSALGAATAVTVGNSFGQLGSSLRGIGQESLSGFSQSFEDLKSGLSGLGGEAASVDKLEGSFSGFLDTLENAGSGGVEALSTAFGGLKAAFTQLASQGFDPLLGKFETLVGSLSNTVTAIQGFQELAPALAKGFNAVKGAVLSLNAAMLANPYTLILTALAAVAAALVIFKDETVTLGDTTATVGDFVAGTWQTTRDRLSERWKEIVGLWASVSEQMVGIWNAVIRGLSFGFDVVRETVNGVITSIAGFFSTIAEAIVGAFQFVLGFVQDVLNKIIAGLKTLIDTARIAVETVASGDFDSFFDKLSVAAEENQNRDFVGELVGGLAEGAQVALEAVGGVAQVALDKTREFAGEAAFIAAETFKGAYSDVVAFVDESLANAESRFGDRPATDPAASILSPGGGLLPPGDEEPNKICDAEELEACAQLLADLQAGIFAVQQATEQAAVAMNALTEAPVESFVTAVFDFEDAMGAAQQAVADQEELLKGLNQTSEEFADHQLALAKEVSKLNDLRNESTEELGKYGEEVETAIKSLIELSKAEEGAFDEEQLKAYQSAMVKLQESLGGAQEKLKGLASTDPEFSGTQQQVQNLLALIEQFKLKAADLGIPQEAVEGTEETTNQLVDLWNGFAGKVEESLFNTFDQVIDGNTDAFEDFFDNIDELFKSFIKDLAKQALRNVIKIPLQIGGGKDGKGGGGFLGGIFGGGDGGGSIETGDIGEQINDSLDDVDLGKYVEAAITGYAIGTLIGSFLAKEDNYAKLGGQIGGVIGGIIGAYFGSPEAGAAIGSAIGSLLGSLIKKGLPRATATLKVEEGRAAIDAFVTRNGADIDQIRQYATEVVKGINEVANRTDGILLDLPDVKLDIKNNKFFQVINESGIVTKFGEDYEAAVNFAILQSIKGASFDGLSAEVQAAIRNSRATTVEELADDIEFAKEVRDIDLDPVTKDLRDVIRKFTEMRERAKSLGIEIDKVDSAFSKAVNEIRDNILNDLKAFEDAGLTDVEREANRITEAFAKLREEARQFNEELLREQTLRNEEIASLQAQLEEQERLKEFYDRFGNIEFPDFPDVDPEFGIRDFRNRPDFARLAQEAGEEIARLMEEIARLANLNAEQQLIDLQRIEEAERRARAALRERVRDSLFQYTILDLTPVQQQLANLGRTFDKLRRDARAAGVPISEVNSAQARAVQAIRDQLIEQLRPFEDMIAGLTPLEVELRGIREQFDELRINAGELGIELERVNAAEEAAINDLRDRFRNELQGFLDAGENPTVVELRKLQEQFEELQANADALEISMDEVNDAFAAALEVQRRQLQESLQEYLDYGDGLSDLAIQHRDLTKLFEDQLEAARALDEAMGLTGEGPGANEQMVLDAQAAAFQQLVDQFNESLQDLRDAGLGPVEIALRDMRDRFTELRANAELLGLSLDELTRLEMEAIDRMRGELQDQLDEFLLTDEEREQKSLEEQFFGFLRDALDIFNYDPLGGDPESPEPFPAAGELENSFLQVKQTADELQLAFRGIMDVLGFAPAGPYQSIDGGGLLSGPLTPTPEDPSELVFDVVDVLGGLLGGRGLGDLDPTASEEIQAAAADLNLQLQKLRLGLTDDVPGIQEALHGLTTMLRDAGVPVGDALLQLGDVLAGSDIDLWVQDLVDNVAASGEGIGDLLAALLAGGDITLADLMHDLADGTFDAILAMLELTELPEDLAQMLQDIGLAFEEAERQQASRRAPRSSGVDAQRAAEQLEREREALIAQLERFEDLALSPAERELKRLNEQFDEMRENAERLGVSLDRVEAAYQIALEDFWERVLGPIRDFQESLNLSEFSPLTPQQRLEEAQSQFDDLARRALAGDFEAIQALPNAAQQLLQEAQGMFASGQGFQDIFDLVNSILAQVLGSDPTGTVAGSGLSGGERDRSAALFDGFDGMAAATGRSFDQILASMDQGVHQMVEATGGCTGRLVRSLEGGMGRLLRTTADGFAQVSEEVDFYGGRPSLSAQHPAGLGAPGQRPVLKVDTGEREKESKVVDELRMARLQSQANAREMHEKMVEQAEEIKELRALMRRVTSRMEFGTR